MGMRQRQRLVHLYSAAEEGDTRQRQSLVLMVHVYSAGERGIGGTITVAKSVMTRSSNQTSPTQTTA